MAAQGAFGTVQLARHAVQVAGLAQVAGQVQADLVEHIVAAVELGVQLRALLRVGGRVAGAGNAVALGRHRQGDGVQGGERAFFR
ncbi:hypothetical protein D9M70_578800 [compost metagenome]